MSVDLQLKTRAAVAAASTALNGVVSAAGQLCDSVIDNGNAVVAWPYGKFIYTGTFAAAPTAGAVLEIYAAQSEDLGTTYETTSNGTSGTAPGLFLGTIPIDPVTTAQTKKSAWLAIPPGVFKVWVKNSTGQTMPTSTGGLTMVAATETGV